MKATGEQAERQLLQMKEKFLQGRGNTWMKSVSEQQARTTCDLPGKGPVWVSRECVTAPADDALISVLKRSIRCLGNGHEQFKEPSLAPVNIQWNSFRSDAGAKEPEPDLDEEEKYRRLCKEASSRTVLFYLHGGALYTGSAAFSRNLTSDLARRTQGRVASLNYRLCPQHPFPEPLLDAFVAYLSLLHPPQGVFHEPVRPQDIVFAADSAGTMILLALLLLIQDIQAHDNGKIIFHGQEILVPMPAGFAGLGVQGDLPHCMPWDTLSHEFDFLHPVSPPQSGKLRSCSAWPSSPPRGDVYCETSALDHPLVSPIISKSWKAMPPMFMIYGEEYLKNEGLFIADRAVSDGIVVEWHKYERLMHIFPTVTPRLPQSRHAMERWAQFCHKCVYEPSSLRTISFRYPAHDSSLEGVESGKQTSPYNLDDLQHLMDERIKQIRPYTGPATSLKL